MFLSADDSCLFQTHSVSAGELHVNHLRFSASMRSEIDAVPVFLSLVLLGGGIAFRSGKDYRVLRRGDSIRYPTDAILQGTWSDIEVVVVQFPLDVAAEVAEAGFGMSPVDLRFKTLTPVSPALGRFWGATAGHLYRELRAEDSALGYPLLRAEMTRMLAAAALSAFPNTTMELAHPPREAYSPPAVVRRAVAFIDANAERAITVSEIATAASVGVRALQQAFARHLDTTPLAYLRRVRMERAHRDLQAAEPSQGATVREIAARWGFGKPERFAAHYRDAFGVPPSHTLRR
jgi:AraC-like DNA-binding protein